MSLRDQLLAKGLASKKDAKRVERELEAQRRQDQGNAKARAEREAEERAARASEEAARLEAQQVERRAREARREAVERELRIGNLIRDNRERPGHGQGFWVRAEDRAVRLNVSSGIAFNLRNGQAAIAVTGEDYAILPRKAALKLRDLAPERLVFFVDDPTGISAPDLAFRARTWDPDLGARRATDADLERFRDPSTHRS